ncbi:MAG: hypothetical protein C4341_06650 [Armatimonadota bacterium]
MAMLTAAGFGKPSLTRVEVDYFLRIGREEAFEMILALSGGLQALWVNLGAEERATLRQEIIAALDDPRGEAHVYVASRLSGVRDSASVPACNAVHKDTPQFTREACFPRVKPPQG